LVHGKVLHGQDGLGPEPAHNEIHLLAREQQFHGIGGIRDAQELIRIRLDELDLHLLAADLDTSLGIQLLCRHGGSVPMPFALNKIHGADHAYFDHIGCQGGENHGEDKAESRYHHPSSS
jgi:hypothetical protein